MKMYGKKASEKGPFYKTRNNQYGNILLMILSISSVVIRIHIYLSFLKMLNHVHNTKSPNFQWKEKQLLYKLNKNMC